MDTAQRRNTAATCLVLVVAGAGLAGCRAADQGPGGGGTASPPTVTRTVTVTVTPTVPPTVPPPRLSNPVTPPVSPMTPPQAKDQPIPSTSQSYAQDFVAAWARQDRARLDELGSPAAVTAASARRATTAPSLTRCEGAAGSSYCTFTGSDYSMIVRVLNEMASQAQPHAVIELRFGS
jgi:hypothetical protein